MPTVPFLGSYGDISGSGLMFRNKLVNGNFDVWQRGTSFTTNDVYSSDRWVTVVSGTCTHARESSDIPDGSQYVHRWTTGAASSFGQIKQYIETSEVVKLRGKTLTASCLVKSSAGFSGNAAFEIFYSTSTDSRAGFSGIDVGGSGSNGQVTSSGWTKITRTFTLPSTAVGLVIGIIPSVVQSSGVWLSMAQVQLEAGPQATPFEQRPIGTELTLCQRYLAYFGGNNDTFPAYVITSATQALVVCTFPQPLRRAPASGDFTISAAGDMSCRLTNGGSTSATAVTFDGSSRYTASIIPGGMSGLVAGNGTFARIQNNGYVYFSAEL